MKRRNVDFDLHRTKSPESTAAEQDHSGPEVITGSTRMKAATAQKMTVNMISTCAMIRLGRVTGNFMTAMRPANTKLRRRAEFIVSSVCGVSGEEAAAALQKNGFNIRQSAAELRGRQGGSEA